MKTDKREEPYRGKHVGQNGRQHSRQNDGEHGGKQGVKKRRLLPILLVLILLLAAACGVAVWYLYKTTEASLDVRFTTEEPDVEFGQPVDPLDLVKTHTGNITVSENALDTGSAGTKKIIYTVSQPLFGGSFGGILTPSKEFALSYNVIDEDKPVMLQSGNGSVIEKGSEFDIDNIIAYGDNADPSPDVRVDGTVDTSRTGTYPLHVTVTDASGNSIDWDLNVEVAENVPGYDIDTEKMPFEDFISDHRSEGKAFGIDVSEWQNGIDFEKVKAAGCEYVIIRIGYSRDGELTVDSRFEENFRNAREAGLKIGAYVYCSDNSEEKVRDTAKQAVEMLGGEPLDLPIAFDWEDFSHFQTYKMSFYGLNRLYDAFTEEISVAGYECMLYGSKIFLENIWEKTDERPVWLAHYTGSTDYKGKYVMWQASCTGRINGISGDVDMDILY